jgi:hypothetical protein
MRFHKKISTKFKKGLTDSHKQKRQTQKTELINSLKLGGDVHSKAIELFEKKPTQDIRKTYSQAFSDLKINKNLLTRSQRRTLIFDLKKLKENNEYITNFVNQNKSLPNQILNSFLEKQGFKLTDVKVSINLAGKKGVILKNQKQLVKILEKPGSILRVANPKISHKLNPHGLVFIVDQKILNELFSAMTAERTDIKKGEIGGFANIVFFSSAGKNFKKFPFSFVSESAEKFFIETHEKNHMIDFVLNKNFKNPSAFKPGLTNAVHSLKTELVASLMDSAAGRKFSSDSIDLAYLDLAKFKKQGILSAKQEKYYQNIFSDVNKLIKSGYSKKQIASIIRNTSITALRRKFKQLMSVSKK